MIKQIATILLALSSSALTQAKRCQTGPKGSGPALEGFDMSMIVLHDLDGSWNGAPIGYIQGVPDLKTCIEHCYNRHEGTDTGKHCAAFGYQEGVQNCDLYNALPYQHNKANYGDKGRLYVGEFGPTCESFSGRDQTLIEGTVDCCDLNFPDWKAEA